MSAAPAVAPRRRAAAAWMPAAVRALLALVLGLVTTFTSGHSAAFGLIAFGVYGVTAGAALLAGALLALARPVRGSFLVQAVVTVAAGVGALALANGDVVALVGIVSAWAIVTGALELIAGLRSRGRDRSARDWILGGGLTIVLGLAFLLVPPGFSQRLGGLENITGTLTASVILVGVLGAWGIVTGVLQAISAVSLHSGAGDASEEHA